MDLNSHGIRSLNIKSFSNQSCRGVIAVQLLRLPFVASTASVCLQFRPSVCSVASCFGVCLLCTRMSTCFSAVHSVVLVCVGEICLLFNLTYEKTVRAQAPLPVVKISKETSPQRWWFSFPLKRNETKHKQILHKIMHATHE